MRVFSPVVLIGSLLVLAALGALRPPDRPPPFGAFRYSTVGGFAARHFESLPAGAHATPILASLRIGVMFTLTVYFLQHSLLDESG